MQAFKHSDLNQSCEENKNFIQLLLATELMELRV